MQKIERIVTNPRRGRAVTYNGILFVGGQVADDRTQDIRGQAAQALAKIDRILAEAGSSKECLLTAQIWMKDISRDFAAMNEIWDSWTDPRYLPARATCQCELGAPDALIEVIVTAAVA